VFDNCVRGVVDEVSTETGERIFLRKLGSSDKRFGSSADGFAGARMKSATLLARASPVAGAVTSAFAYWVDERSPATRAVCETSPSPCGERSESPGGTTAKELMRSRDATANARLAEVAKIKASCRKTSISL